MPEADLVPRVTTVVEVDDRIASGFVSFEDWIDCLEVCQREQRRDLAETCAHHALEAAMNRPLPAVKLVQAARAVVSGALPRWANGPDWLDAGARGYAKHGNYSTPVAR